MYSERFLLWLPILLYVMCSCSDEVKIERPNIDSSGLSVLAVLTNNDHLSVTVSKVTEFNGPGIDFNVDNLTIELYEDDSLILTIQEPFNYRLIDESPASATWYLSPTGFALNDGSNYQLKIFSPDYDTVISEPVPFEAVYSEDFEYINSVTQINQNFRNEVEINYRIDMTALGSSELFNYAPLDTDRGLESYSYTHYQLYRTRYGNPEGFDLPPGEYLRRYPPSEGQFDPSVSDYRCFRVINLNPHYLKFARALQNQSREDIGGSDEASQPLPNNLRGGYGYFSVVDNQFDCIER